MEDVMRRWHSIRDQYRRERQQRVRSGSAAPAKKCKYIYYDRLSFLDPSMDWRATQSNLTERETGSDSEAIIDPVGEGQEVAGPSSHPSSVLPPATSSVATQDPEISGQETAEPPTAAPHPESQEEAGNSSSPTVPLETSPQAAVISRRGRRRRELQESHRNVDTGVLNYLARAAQDDGEEAFVMSLVRYLHPIPHEARLRVRGCIQILIDSCTPPNYPYELFEIIERWQLSSRSLLRIPSSQQVHDQQVFEAPPPRVPTPLPLPTQNQPRPAHYNNPTFQQPSQYGHLSRPSAGGWSQPGFGRHGHIGWGYEPRPFVQPHEGQTQSTYFSSQNPTGQYDQGHHFEQGQTSNTQDDVQLVQQRPPDQNPELPPSPPPTYRNL
ncbi:uncharacterized protein [Ranitomeya imitator]|uniref:uncharacterized protein n=1 Tax=Ranitomeya imitator TaxID=111125 RepID=UPI0037E80EE0